MELFPLDDATPEDEPDDALSPESSPELVVSFPTDPQPIKPHNANSANALMIDSFVLCLSVCEKQLKIISENRTSILRYYVRIASY